MPYTPPSAQSPVASRTDTPSLSRSHSHKNIQGLHNGHPIQSSLPSQPTSSSSYLSKHRRSPSITKTPTFVTEPPTSKSHKAGETLDGSNDQDKDHPPGNKKHDTQSPNVPLDDSPSVSPPSSGDDEATEGRGRKRDITKLAELQAAIRIIEQHRAGSPDAGDCEETKRARAALGLPGPRLDVSKTSGASRSELSPQLPLSAGARKISHSRSTTSASAFFDFPRNKFDSPVPSTSQSDDSDSEEDGLRIKPNLIRKKSGELVRPALRASSLKRRPSSMPGTPTYSKAVHFQDSSLEHIRHFLQVDRPIAVSAGSSPVDPHDEDAEFPLGSEESSLRSPPFDWEIRLTNFPRTSIEREALPVRTEKVYLSPDTKVLLGLVAVRNLAFHKLVVARFTLDYWKTTSEVIAEYHSDMRTSQANDGCDRFLFSIKLEDQVNLENKTMFFCVRYSVNGQDYWDNNRSINYQIDFSKKYKPRNGKQGIQAKDTPNALPRSRPSPRPRSMPSFDDFANMASPFEFSSFPQPSTIVGDSPIRFKSKPPAEEIVSDAPGKPKTSANQQAFGNRYDFGASLSAAIQAAGSSINSTKETVKSAQPRIASENAPAAKIQPVSDASKSVGGNETRQPIQEIPKPAALTSEKPSLSSSSYHELLDKYCFFGSGKPTSNSTNSNSPQLDKPSDKSLAAANKSSKTSVSPSPSPPRSSSPAVKENVSSSQVNSPQASRSPSPVTGPGLGSRTASPTFRYPYHQAMQTGLFETHTPTAIRG